MTLAIYDKFITKTDSGETIPSATVSIYNAETAALAQLYTDIDGTTNAGNPVTASSSGRVQVYMAAGRYNITAVSNGSSVNYPNVLIGIDIDLNIVNNVAYIDYIDQDNALSSIQSLINDGVEVRLPAGHYTEAGALYLKSGSKISGAGAMRYDTDNDVWVGDGTLINFAINVDDCNGFTVSDLSVSSSSNDGVSGSGVTMGNGRIIRVNTNTNNHAVLLNLICPDPYGAMKESNGVVGGFIVEQCEHWGGVNGYVSKHHNVTFRKCISHNTASQDFTAISDNINGATLYNRGTFTTFEGCISYDSANGFRSYTRDVFSADIPNNENTNNVQSCYMTTYRNCKNIGNSQYPMLIGDFDSAVYAVLQCENIIIDDYGSSIANFGNIRLQLANKVKLTNCEFRIGTSIRVNQTNCQNVIIDDSNVVESGSNGDEIGLKAVSDNSSELSLAYWTSALVVRFNNTVDTRVNSFPKMIYGKAFALWIDDNFTSIDLNGAIYSGKGTRIVVANTSGVWRILSSSNDISDSVKYLNYSSSLTLNYDAYRNKTLAVSVTGSIFSLNFSYSTLSDGQEVFARFDCDSTDRSISGYSANIDFETTPPSTLLANTTLLFHFYKSGSKLIELSRRVY